MDEEKKTQDSKEDNANRPDSSKPIVAKRHLHATVEQDRGISLSIEAQSRDKDYARKKSSDWLVQMPTIPKAAFIKFWFAGAVYFFFGWALSFGNMDGLDRMAVIGVVLGVATDFIANRIAFGLDNIDQTMKRYVMFGSRKAYFVFFNVIYAVILSGLVAGIYAIISVSFDTVFGVDPILFGVFYMLLDFLFVWIRNIVFNRR